MKIYIILIFEKKKVTGDILNEMFLKNCMEIKE